jgi:methionine-gamma-lyase
MTELAARTTETAGFSTRAVHAGDDANAGRAVATPIYQTSAFRFRDADEGAAMFAGVTPGDVYTRWSNPNATELEAKVAALEGAEAGLAAASGMAAISAIVLSHLAAGDHAIVDAAVYSATYTLFSVELPRYGIGATFVDTGDPAAVETAIRPETRLIYTETPGNPTLKIVDLAALAGLARARGIPTVCDNTFASPYVQRPIELGIDTVVHSATKYLGGHGDAIAGVAAGSRELMQRARTTILRDFGGVISPMTAYLIARGIATLPLRVERQCSNALTIARFLAEHAAVERVAYPGLPAHPRHDVAARQMHGFGGMIAFDVKGGIDAGRAVMDAVRLCTLAVSLGDARTLICHPASMTHSTVSAEARHAAGIGDGLVRLSVGIEDVQDLIDDLDQALRCAGAARAQGSPR